MKDPQRKKLNELLLQAGDIEALKIEADSAEEWKNKYIKALEDYVDLSKKRLFKKPTITDKQIAKIKEMAKNGYSYTEIGRAVDRTAGVVHRIVKQAKMTKN